jgi:hypothetical protein
MIKKATESGCIKPANLYYVKLGEMNEDNFEEDIMRVYGNHLIRSSKKATDGVQDKSYWIEYDWVDNINKTKIELKSRNLRHNAFPTTMLGNNKVVNALKDKEYQYVYLFGFLDGLYAWDLNDENLKKCNVRIGSIGVGGNDYLCQQQRFNGVETPTKLYSPFNKTKQQLYIPVEDMVKISDKGIILPPVEKKIYKFLGGL